MIKLKLKDEPAFMHLRRRNFPHIRTPDLSNV